MHFLWILLIAGISTTCNLRAQQDITPPDFSTPDSLEFTFEPDVFGYISGGFFPEPYPALTLVFTHNLFYSDVINRADNIRSASFRETPFPFHHSDPTDDSDEREILQPFCDETTDDDYPSTDYNEYILRASFQLPFPLILQVDVSYLSTSSLLYSKDDTRSFLTNSGSKKSFTEVGVIHLGEEIVRGSAAITIPFYGGFIDLYSFNIYSYYYVSIGHSWQHVLSSEAIQYVQITDAKDELRYNNGQDTVRLFFEEELSGLQHNRRSLDFAIGWNFGGFNLALGLEAFLSIPQTSILQDIQWQQYTAGVRFSVGYHWPLSTSPEEP